MQRTLVLCPWSGGQACQFWPKAGMMNAVTSLARQRLTFYDDEVTKFFFPHAKGKSAIFLVAVGKSAPAK